MFNNLDLYLIIPDMFFMLSVLSVLGVVVFMIDSTTYRYPLLLNFTLYTSILIIIYELFFIINNPWYLSITFNSMFIVDNHSFILKLLILTTGGLCLLISKEYLAYSKINKFEYPILLLLSIEGMMLLVSSYDLFTIYLALEFQSLCFYVLATFKRYSESSTEAGLKYFVLGSISSGLLLYGISLVYGTTGTTNLEELSKLFLLDTYPVDNTFFDDPNRKFKTAIELLNLQLTDRTLFSGTSIGILFILTAFLFKLTAAPFHMWSPDVYEGSPTSTTALFAIVSKVAIAGTILRLYSNLFSYFSDQLDSIFIFCCLASILLGSLAALYQKSIKRFLTFTSINHVGFLLLAIISGTLEGVLSFYFYLTVYCVMFILIFTIIFSLKKELGENALLLKDFKYMGTFNKAMAFSLLVSLFSLAGVPPLAGFFSKYFILVSGANIQYYLVVIVGLIFSTISAFYYVRIIKMMYFDNLSISSWPLYKSVSTVNAYVISLSTIFLISFVFNFQFVDFIYSVLYN